MSSPLFSLVTPRHKVRNTRLSFYSTYCIILTNVGEMKFVFNEEKNGKMREILMMQPKVEEGKAILEKDETDPYGW